MRSTATEFKPYTVFLSYSWEDAYIAKQITKTIKKTTGADVWIDIKNLEAGRPISEGIIAGLDSCQEAVVLVTPCTEDSHWVPIEIGAALGQHKQITPILCHVKAEAVPALSNVRAVDLNHFQAFCLELKRRVEQYKAESIDC